MAKSDIVTYKVAGNEVKLSEEIVSGLLARGNAKVSHADIISFIQLCRFNCLNPFLGEAFLVKYDAEQPAQLVVSKEALFKKAESNPAFEGIESGIIVERNGEIVELEGTFKLDTDKLLGGWAKVYRKDRKTNTIAKVNLSEFNTGKALWRTKPQIMISKVAKCMALREAFPVQLGGMYTSEEQMEGSFERVVEDADHEELKKANSQLLDFNDDPEPETPKRKRRTKKEIEQEKKESVEVVNRIYEYTKEDIEKPDPLVDNVIFEDNDEPDDVPFVDDGSIPDDEPNPALFDDDGYLRVINPNDPGF